MLIYRLFRGAKESIIMGGEEKEVADLPTLPRFICFDGVQLFYNRGPESIEEKCHLIENHLQPINRALKDSKSIQFYGIIDRNHNRNFSDHLSLLDYLSERLLSFYNSSRRYEFEIGFRSDKESASNVLSSILQAPEISGCTDLCIRLYDLEKAKHLPVQAISNWLNRKMIKGMEVFVQTPQEISLKIYLRKIQNALDLCGHLENVRLILRVKFFPRFLVFLISYRNIRCGNFIIKVL